MKPWKNRTDNPHQESIPRIGPLMKAAYAPEDRFPHRHPSPCRTLFHRSLFIRAMLVLCISVTAVLSGACTRMLSSHYADTPPPMEGTLAMKDLHQNVTIRRDNMGIPFIEASDMRDLSFAVGYVHASDRLTQMVGFKLISQGRLSEMAGQPALDIDIFMRTLNLVKAARILFEGLSEENKDLLGWYARGVNAYIEQHRDRLPPELALSGYDPGKWEAFDSICIAALLDLALSFNMHEEIDSLVIAQAIGAGKAALLSPVHPDEPIPWGEGRKLEGIDLRGSLSLTRLTAAGDMLATLGLRSVAASNNWVISKERTAAGASIFANDTHLMLTMPSLWNMMHIRCKDMDAAGVCAAGLPSIIAGYNGRIAWGMTMVMADNQDLFLEKIKVVDGKIRYLHKGSWLPATERKETFIVKGKKPEQIVVHETIHGPLINDILSRPARNFFMSDPIEIPYGLAFSWAAFEPGDRSLDACFSLSKAGSVEEALPIIRQIQVMPLNMVVADKDNIAWQVTGRYPIRKNGRGLLTSPGWTGEYDWKGFLDPSVLPHTLNPPEGYMATANNRTVPADYPYILSSSWYWPERVDRIKEMITSTKSHTMKTSMDIQLDTHTSAAEPLRKLLLEGDLSGLILHEIDSWTDKDKQLKAKEALAMFRRFDGNMSSESRTAPVFSAFMHVLSQDIFLDELGPEDSRTWKAFISCNSMSYSAVTDHLMVRGDESPFWDNIQTQGKETKAQIIAGALARSYELLSDRLGRDRSTWSWGRLHTYDFVTESSKMAPQLGFLERAGMSFMSSYFNRGPFPASGDFTTPNISAYMIGRDFNTWLIPAMRLVADFGLEEPFFGVNSTGQSDNPSSPHYDDGIHAWMKGEYLNFPFARDRIEKQYSRVLVLKPEDRS